MSKLNNVYTREKEQKQKKKKLIKNGTYAIILACSIILGATLVAVNIDKPDTTNQAAIQTSVQQNNYISPLSNATVIKDYNDSQLQYNDTLKQWEIHKGIDITSDTDNRVVVIANGTVTDIYTNYLEGTVIEISHSNGLVSRYKSLNDDINVKLGDSVKQGAVIGTIDSTMAREQKTGNHLHFELLLNNVLVNPNNYIDFSKK